MNPNKINIPYIILTTSNKIDRKSFCALKLTTSSKQHLFYDNLIFDIFVLLLQNSFIILKILYREPLSSNPRLFLTSLTKWVILVLVMFMS